MKVVSGRILEETPCGTLGRRRKPPEEEISAGNELAQGLKVGNTGRLGVLAFSGLWGSSGGFRSVEDFSIETGVVLHLNSAQIWSG
jgi:hypothetical protein